MRFHLRRPREHAPAALAAPAAAPPPPAGSDSDHYGSSDGGHAALSDAHAIVDARSWAAARSAAAIPAAAAVQRALYTPSEDELDDEDAYGPADPPPPSGAVPPPPAFRAAAAADAAPPPPPITAATITASSSSSLPSSSVSSSPPPPLLPQPDHDPLRAPFLRPSTPPAAPNTPPTLSPRKTSRPTAVPISPPTPRGQRKSLPRQRASDSEDDVPLGERVVNPAGLQRNLQRTLRRTHRRDRSKSSAATGSSQQSATLPPPPPTSGHSAQSHPSPQNSTGPGPGTMPNAASLQPSLASHPAVAPPPAPPLPPPPPPPPPLPLAANTIGSTALTSAADAYAQYPLAPTSAADAYAPAPPQTQVPSRVITRSNTTRRKKLEAPPPPAPMPNQPVPAAASLQKQARPIQPPVMPMPWGVDPSDLIRRLQVVADQRERDDRAQVAQVQSQTQRGLVSEQAELNAWHAAHKASSPNMHLSRHTSARRRPAPILNATTSGGVPLSPPPPPLEEDQQPALRSLRRSKSRGMKDVTSPPSAAVPAVPPVPRVERPADQAPTSPAAPLLTSHKVFVVTRQRYVHIECRPEMRAKELVLAVLAKTNVSQTEDNSAQPGAAWVVWDVSPRWGVERPLREYEKVGEAVAARTGAEDYFLLRRTELAGVLSTRSVPSQSPVLAGWVHVYTCAKSKWARKWLELHDHGLWVAKSSSGKDAAFLCSLATFDAYLFSPSLADSSLVPAGGTSVPKPPKQFSFAVRSQDKVTLFEKPDQDYVHYFSLSDPAAHRDWVKNVLLARTYLIAQEHPHLLASMPVQQSTGASLSRSGTARRPWGPREPSSPPPPLPLPGQAQPQSQPQSQSQSQAQSHSQSLFPPVTTSTSPPRKFGAPLVKAADLFRGPFAPGSLLASQQEGEPLPLPNVPRNARFARTNAR